MTCPECDRALVAKQEDAITIDACSACRGIWFDRGELEVYSSRRNPTRMPPADPERFAAGSEAPLACPRCTLDTLVLGSIHALAAGVCSCCRGVWVRPGYGASRTSSEASSGWADFGLELAAEAALEALSSVFD